MSQETSSTSSASSSTGPALPPSFDLVDQPWIPVRAVSGVLHHVGLRDALIRAHEWERLSHPSPLVESALYRLLLALSYRVLGCMSGELAWKRVWDESSFDSELVHAYFGEWADRFDLFHPDYPFYQVRDLQTQASAGEPADAAPIAKLMVERASGSNPALFDHSFDEAPSSLAAGEAACHLLATQAWSLGGGKSASTNVFGKHPNYVDAPLVGGVFSIIMGRNLRETLVLNHPVGSPPIPPFGAEAPVWEQEARDRPPGKARCRGYLDYLTWTSRMVRLLPEAEPGGAWVVKHAYLANGLQLDMELPIPHPFAPVWKDPDGKKPSRTLGLREQRALWRDADALLAMSSESRAYEPSAFVAALRTRRRNKVLPPSQHARIACYGLANKKAKVLRWESQRIPIRIEQLDDRDAIGVVSAAMESADQMGRALSKAFHIAATEVLPASPDRPDRPARGNVASLRDAMIARCGYWAELDPHADAFFREMSQLAPGDTETREQLVATWRAHITSAARRAFDTGIASMPGRMARKELAVVRGEKALWPLIAKLSPTPKQNVQGPTTGSL